MIGIRVNNIFLDLGAPDAPFTIDLNSPMYLGGDPDVIPGSISLPRDVPTTYRNLETLGYLNRMDSTGLTLEHSCEIWFDGKYLFRGTLISKGATRKTIRTYIIIQNKEALRKKGLNEIDMGGDLTPEANLPDLLAMAKDTTVNPLDRPYIFFPVFNDGFWSELDPETTMSNYQNHYNRSTQQFVSHFDHLIAMPFVRMDYLLSRISVHAGYAIQNDWQINDELKKLCIWNNYSIYKQGDWGLTFNLQNHVSGTRLNDYLKNLNKTFALGLFFNDPDSVMEIIPIKDLIARPHVHDWTRKASEEFSTEEERFTIRLSHAEDSNDGLEGFNRSFNKELTGVLTSLQDYDPFTHPDGYYLLRAENRVHYFSFANFEGLSEGEILYPYVSDPDTENDVSTAITPLYSVFDKHEPGGLGAGLDTRWMPAIRAAGTYPDSGMRNPMSDRIIFYREMAEDENGVLFPLASSNVYKVGVPLIYGGDGREIRIADYSLYWADPAPALPGNPEDYGLYTHWWKNVVEMLKNSKKVKVELNLNITDILNFRFQDKVRIRNMNYFVQKLRITFRGSRIMTQADLISTV